MSHFYQRIDLPARVVTPRLMPLAQKALARIAAYRSLAEDSHCRYITMPPLVCEP